MSPRVRRHPRRLDRLHTPASVQARTFFGLPIFSKRRNAVTEPRLDPGIDKLQEHAKRFRLNARLDSPQIIRHAMLQYIKHKQAIKTPLQDKHTALLRSGYKHIRKSTHTLETQDLKALLQLFSIPQSEWRPHGGFEEQVKGRLAIQVFADLLERSHMGAGGTQHAVGDEEVQWCFQTLCQTGRSERARELVSTNMVQTTSKDKGSPKNDAASPSLRLPEFDKKKAFTTIVKGFASEGSETGILQTLEFAAEQGVSVAETPSLSILLCQFYIKERDTANVKNWYRSFLQAEEQQAEERASQRQNNSALIRLYEDLIQFCIETGEREWGQQIAADMLETINPKRARDLTLVWAAGCGKGYEEINRMMDIMEQSQNYRVDIDSINRLIGLALWQKDAYKAERFFNLGLARNIKPNAKTYIMQIDYRCSVNDVDGALTAYSNMQSGTYPEDGEESDSVNKLVRAMCSTRVHDFESIMNVAADLTDSGARFDAETVSTLAVLHLSRAELDDAEDLLNTHSFQYSVAERRGILDSIIDFCLNPENSSEVAWATYELLKKIFDDMDRDQRTKLMMEFMRRGLGHLAVQIFEHMRLHSRADTLPTMETYAQCLQGITRLEDDESFNALYNLLKLDTSIEPNTALHNALMEACIACGESPQALVFWSRITSSDEGPDLMSINLVMRACQDAPQGDDRALEIHGRLEASGFEMRPSYYAWVLAVLGAHGKVPQAIEMMEQLWQEKGVAPSMDM